MALLTKAELRNIYDGDRKKESRRFRRGILAVFALFLFCLCFKFNAYAFDEKFVPLEYLKSYFFALRLLCARIADSALWYQRTGAIEALGSVTYYGALAQLRLMLMSFAAGAGLALSGAIFQTAYRNPMALPNIIGASAGVSLGNVVVVMLFSAQAYANILLRYKYCYGFTVICVALVFLLKKLTGSKRTEGSILEMILVGSVISQMVRVFTLYFMYNLAEEELVLYEQISLGIYMQTDVLSMTIFFAVMAASMLPILLLRYRLNVLGMDKLETAALGVNEKALSVMAQICGVMMMTCAMIHYGEVGKGIMIGDSAMVPLVIPYVLRRTIGSDFCKLSVYSVLAGGSLLMLCRLIGSFILVAGAPIPVTTIIELSLVPVFVFILLRQRSTAYEA